MWDDVADSVIHMHSDSNVNSLADTQFTTKV